LIQELLLTRGLLGGEWSLISERNRGWDCCEEEEEASWRRGGEVTNRGCATMEEVGGRRQRKGERVLVFVGGGGGAEGSRGFIWEGREAGSLTTWISCLIQVWLGRVSDGSWPLLLFKYQLPRLFL